MTAYEEIKQETTLSILKGLVQNGASLDLIAKSFGLSIPKIEIMIQKTKESNN